MRNFLRKLQLSDFAIKIYLKSLGKQPLTYYELYSIDPSLTSDKFNEILNELLNAGLLLQQVYKKENLLTHYYSIPPILPILNYYENIDANLINIKNSIQKLMITSINEIFKNNKVIELDAIVASFEEKKKDIDEDSIIQKKEIEDIVESMEVLKELKTEMVNLQKEIKGITQTKSSSLVKSINSFKTELIADINALEFKKHKQEIILIVENKFKERIQNILDDFISDLRELIEIKLLETTKSFENLSNLMFQYREDFKMLLLNMLSNFETKMNKIYDLLNENKEDLDAHLKNLEIKIVEKLNSIIQNSIDEVSGLNKPIEEVLKTYFQEIPSSENFIINKVWIIRSVTKINEEIQKIIAAAQENLTIIIPSLEFHIAIEQFKDIPTNLKIKIVSSEAHTNSLVKKFKEIKNLEYKTFENENLILLKGDTNNILIGIKQDSTEALNDFIGIGSNYESFIALLNPIVKALWKQSYSDTFYAAQKVKTQGPSPKPTSSFKLKTITQKFPKKIEPKVTSKKISKEFQTPAKTTKSTSVQITTKKSKKVDKIPKEVPKKPSVSIPKIKGQIEDLKQKLQEKIEFLSAVHPKEGDKAGLVIDKAFDELILKIHNIKGDEFSKGLQVIADLILENKGFSVTLHKVRGVINKYKEKLDLLEEEDKKEIFQNFEEWKQKFF